MNTPKSIAHKVAAERKIVPTATPKPICAEQKVAPGYFPGKTSVKSERGPIISTDGLGDVPNR